MPPAASHLEQARHNANFYATIDKAVCADWAITVLFYTALHYVDALLAQQGVHPTSHAGRNRALERIAELRPIYADYESLKNASYNARYEPPVGYTPAHVEAYESRNLARIRSQVGQYISI